MDENIVTIVAEESGDRVDALLARSMDSLTRSAAQRLIEDGAVLLGGKAVKKIVKGSCSGPGGVLTFTFAAWIPKSEKKVPAFIHVSPRPAATADDPNGPRPVYLLPAEYITSRGYAALASCDYDFAPDWKDTPPVATSGVFKVFGPAEKATRAPTAWGILSAWSWGASRVLDWVETQAAIDAAHVGVVGLSRNGKTALCAGILDSRFAMAVSCCSGCGGAKLNHMVCEGSESIEAITRPALMWFCPNFKQYVGKDRSPQLPFDQHQWLALMAPRLLYVSSASEDAWAGPRGEFAAARLASPVLRRWAVRVFSWSSSAFSVTWSCGKAAGCG